MRLLRRDDSGGYSLTEFDDDEPHPYAILSHTWEEGEISFVELISGTYKTKRGSMKLDFCADRAASDGLEYFWVDTCCINKTNVAELNTAINSMFRWGSQSRLAHTAKFSAFQVVHARLDTPRTFGPCIPRVFSRDGQRLGSKKSLLQEVSTITKIREDVLRGLPLSNVSVDERMSWLEGRQTTVKEDAAYSMLGIFGVFLPPIYGEGTESALRRLREGIEVQLQNNDARGHTLRSGTLGQYNSMWVSSPLTNLDLDCEGESDASSVFSDGGSSTSSATTASLKPVQTVGIREVARALLSNHDLKSTYTTAISAVDRRKARARIRSFLKIYGQGLLKEASNNVLMIQAAKFVQELAGRIFDEITRNISVDTTDLLARTSTPRKQDLEGWLSSLQNSEGFQDTSEPHQSGIATGDDDTYEHDEQDESDEEPSDELPFPNIDRVKEFLLTSHAFQEHITTMRTWLKMDQGFAPSAETHHSKVEEETPQETRYEPESFHISAHRNESKQNATGEESTPQPVPHEPVTGTQIRQHRSGSALISGLLDFWGISFFFYDIAELVVPRVPQGLRRLRWRCSCGDVMWGDFLVEDDASFDQLQREVLGLGRSSTQNTSPSGVSRSQTGGGSDSKANSATAEQQEPPAGTKPSTPGTSSAVLTTPSSPGLKTATTVGVDHVVDIAFPPEYFEVCVSIGHHAIDHHEIDISRATSDGELFELIWEKYNTSRGIGIRRLFLRPSNVDFVMFSIGRHTQYGAGIHKKPDEFPPQEELDRKRYHYLCPKIRMPANVFLHYLHRARWNIWGEHQESTWLRRLPKKLNDRLCDHVSHIAQTGQPDPLMDPDLAFGWGIHIIDGPNHAVLGAMLAAGVAVAFVVSGLVVGFTKTQEQGFGIGNFLLAILASIMAAIYFQLQDR